MAGMHPGRPPQEVDDEKLLVVSRALRLRRAKPAGVGSAATDHPVDTGTPHARDLPRAGSVGAVVGWLTLRSGRLGPAIWAHVGFNGLTALVLLVG